MENFAEGKSPPETVSSIINVNHDDFCPRCTRKFDMPRGKLTPKLLKHYKNLCKSSKCKIHKAKPSPVTEARKKLMWKTLCNRERINRITQITVPCRVHEFEDEKEDQHVDPHLFSKIQSTMTEFDENNGVTVEDIIGHGILKQLIRKTIIWPLKKPDIFKGLRSAPKGVLLFGPPGTGKTLLGQWIAYETNSTFFNISSSSLTSKWMGETENLVRTMFIVAKARQPSVIFIDKVDSILSQRISNENGTSRRMKNEFYIQMDDSTTEDRIMIVGTTNRPEELDAAARRRFVKRLYIPLPDNYDRKKLLLKFLRYECHSLEESDVNEIVQRTEGYSAADLKNLSQEAAMGPIKSFSPEAILTLQPNKIRPISLNDFHVALQLIKPSVSREELRVYEKWDSMYGYGSDNSKKEEYNFLIEPRERKSTFDSNPYII